MLILARHGQTDANGRGLLLGRAESPLTELGRAQAAALARALTAARRVISSPLSRALDTAAAFDRPVDVDARWIELDYGEYDLQSWQAVPPEVWTRWRDEPSFTPPGGESLVELGRRVRDACESLAAEAADADVVVVTHVSPIKAAVAWALGAGDELGWRLRVDVASITRVSTSGDRPVLHAFNETVPVEG